MMMDDCWLDPEFVSAALARFGTMYCAREYAHDPRDKHQERSACLRPLERHESGLLACPVHGKDWA